METTEQAIERIVAERDGEDATNADALELCKLMGLPMSFMVTVRNLLDDIIYNRTVVQAFESDPRWAYDQYVLEPGDVGHYDPSTFEFCEQGFHIAAESSKRELTGYRLSVA